MKKQIIILLSFSLIVLICCEQEGTNYRCSAGTAGIFPTPSGCIESENGEFETIQDCESSCKY